MDATLHQTQPCESSASPILRLAPWQNVLEAWVIVNDHHMIEEGAQEAVIEAFLLAHEGHTQDVEVQRGTWSIFCRCARCGEIQTYEVDNEARERALRLPPWQEEERKWA